MTTEGTARNSTCATCKHFRRGKEIGKGECMRYPPTVSVHPIKSQFGQDGFLTQSVFPPTKDSNFCGEYQAKLEMVS